MRAILAAYAILPDREPNESTGRLSFSNLDGLKKRILDAPPRRMGRMTKYACIGAVACLKEADRNTIPAGKLGVFHGSALGNINETHQVQKQIFTLSNQLPSPIKFSASLSNMSSHFVAVLTGAKGPNLVVAQDELSFEGAVLSALLAGDIGDIDFALTGGTDCCFGTQQELSNALNFPEQTLFGEGSGWILLGRNSSASLGEVVDIKIGNSLGALSESDGATTYRKYLVDLINDYRQNQEDIYVVPGLRVDRSQFEGIVDSLSPAKSIEYLNKTGVYPTAAANGIADIISCSHAPGLYVHLAKSGLGQIAIMLFRLKANSV